MKRRLKICACACVLCGCFFVVEQQPKELQSYLLVTRSSMSSTTPSTSTSRESPEINAESQSPINCSQVSPGSAYSPQKLRVQIENYSFEDENDDEGISREIRVWEAVFNDEKKRLLTQQHSHFSWLYPTKDGNVSRCIEHEDCSYLIRISRGIHIITFANIVIM